MTPDNPVAHEPEKEKQTMRFGPAPNPILQMNNNTSDFSVPGSLKIRTSSTVKTPAPETSVSSSPLESTSAQKPETVSDPIKLKQEILTWNNTWGTIDWEQTTDEATGVQDAQRGFCELRGRLPFSPRDPREG